MSTNYYLVTPDTPPGSEGIHLGKFAQGHAFMFRGHPDLGITTYDAWLNLARSGQIVSESGVETTVDELVATVEEAHRMWARFHPSTPRSNQVDDQGHRFTLTEFC